MRSRRRRIGRRAEFPLARVGASAALHVLLAREGIVAHRQLHRLQALDLVSKARRLLEFQIGGGLAHPLFQIADGHLEVVADGWRLGHADVDGDVVLLVDGAENILNAALDRRGRDAVLGVVGELLLATTRGLVHRALHRACDVVRVENDAAVDVARRAANGLHERGLAAQEAFLVGVENGDERAFGNIEALAQQVDADQHVEGAKAQVADDLDALDRVDVAVHVAHAHAVLVQVFRQVFRHALGQRGDERAIAVARHLAHLAEQVVDLRARGADFNRRVDEAGRADDLFDENAACPLHFPRARRG